MTVFFRFGRKPAGEEYSPAHTKATAARDVLGSNRGIALLMVMWILTILVVVSLSFAYMTRTETKASLFYKEGIEKQLIAEAGLARALMELQYRAHYKNSATATLDGSEAVKVNGKEYEGQFGDDLYVYTILDESSKINLNTLTDISGIMLNNLLVNQGVEKETADTIVDSLLDWKDSDDLRRLHGAESDYYQSLPNPYKAKNGDLDTVEELLMIKGVTPEILYGTLEKPGIFGYVTVSSKAGTININAAPKAVLAALPGMTPEMAERIIELREAGDIKSAQDIRGVVGEAYLLMSPHISVSESGVYAIRSTGFKKGETQGYSVEATVSPEGNNKYRTLYYKSPARPLRKQAKQ